MSDRRHVPGSDEDLEARLRDAFRGSNPPTAPESLHTRAAELAERAGRPAGALVRFRSLPLAFTAIALMLSVALVGALVSTGRHSTTEGQDDVTPDPSPNASPCAVSRPDADGEVGGDRAFFHFGLFRYGLAESAVAGPDPWRLVVRVDPPLGPDETITVRAELVDTAQREDAEPRGALTVVDDGLGLPSPAPSGRLYAFDQRIPRPGCWRLTASIGGRIEATAVLDVAAFSGLLQPGRYRTAQPFDGRSCIEFDVVRGRFVEDEDVRVFQWPPVADGTCGPRPANEDMGHTQGTIGPLGDGRQALLFDAVIDGRPREVDIALYPSATGLAGVIASLGDRSVRFDWVEPAVVPPPEPEQDPVVFEPVPQPLQTLEPIAGDVLPVVGRDLPAMVGCHGGFSSDALTGVGGAELLIGPEYDALRRVMVDFWPRMKLSFWEAERTNDRVIFLSRGGDFGLIYLEVAFGPDGWAFSGTGDCRLYAWPIEGYGRATWILDPAFAEPDPSTRTLHVLVSEEACSSGRDARGRISPAFVFTDREEIRIQIFVQKLRRGQDCPATVPTAVTIELPEPLGRRELVDDNVEGCCG